MIKSVEKVDIKDGIYKPSWDAFIEVNDKLYVEIFYKDVEVKASSIWHNQLKEVKELQVISGWLYVNITKQDRTEELLNSIIKRS
jgi:hypothetical protein